MNKKKTKKVVIKCVVCGRKIKVWFEPAIVRIVSPEIICCRDK